MSIISLNDITTMLVRRHCNTIRLLRLFLGLLLVLTPASYAKDDPTIVAELDRVVVEVGESVSLTVSVSGSPDNDIEIPVIDGLEINASGTSTQMSIANGRMSREVIYSFELVPTRAGTFQIPSIEVVVDGAKIRSLPLNLKVNGGPSSSQTPPPSPGQGRSAQNSGADQDSPQDDALSPVFMERWIPEGKYYEGQAISTKVRIFFRTRINIVPERESSPDWRMITGEQQRNYEESRGGYSFKVIEIDEVLIPLKSGTLEVPKYGARVTYVEVQKGSRSPKSVWDLFQNGMGGFGREVSKRLTTQSKTISIQSLPPSDGVDSPQDMVGTFSVDAKISKDTLSRGESATVTLKISGDGALDRLADITLNQKQSGERSLAKIYPDKPKLDELIDDKGLHSEKVFKFAVVPERAGLLEFETLNLGYFDPQKNAWQTLRVALPPIQVDLPKDFSGRESVAPSSHSDASPTESLPSVPSQKAIPSIADRPLEPMPQMLPEATYRQLPSVVTLFTTATIVAFLTAFGWLLIHYGRTTRQWRDKMEFSGRPLAGLDKKLKGNMAGAAFKDDYFLNGIRQAVADAQKMTPEALTADEVVQALKSWHVSEVEWRRVQNAWHQWEQGSFRPESSDGLRPSGAENRGSMSEQEWRECVKNLAQQAKNHQEPKDLDS